MKKLRHVYGTPLIIMMFAVVFLVIIFAGQCGRHTPQVILTDSIPADTVTALSDTKPRAVTTSKRKQKAKKAKLKREVKSRDYLKERVDSVNYDL